MNSPIKKYAVGIDLGGTFVKAALVSETGEIILKDSLPIDSKAQKEDILDTIEKIIYQIIERATKNSIHSIGIGIGTPGIVDEGVVLGGADNLNGWENIDVSSYYSKIFGLPVCVENDANMMGLGELNYGAAIGCTDVICLTIGTGIGGAIMIHWLL